MSERPRVLMFFDPCTTARVAELLALHVGDRVVIVNAEGNREEVVVQDIKTLADQVRDLPKMEIAAAAPRHSQPYWRRFEKKRRPR